MLNGAEEFLAVANNQLSGELPEWLGPSSVLLAAMFSHMATHHMFAQILGWATYTSTPQQVVSGGFSIGNGYQKPPVGGSR